MTHVSGSESKHKIDNAVSPASLNKASCVDAGGGDANPRICTHVQEPTICAHAFTMLTELRVWRAMGASTSKHKIDNGMSPASSSKVSYEDDGDANANPLSLRR